MNNESYLKSMEERKSNQRKLDSLRQFQVGDKVTRYQVTGNKTIDKLSQLQTGPFTVTAVDESGVDYLIQCLYLCLSSEGLYACCLCSHSSPLAVSAFRNTI